MGSLFQRIETALFEMIGQFSGAALTCSTLDQGYVQNPKVSPLSDKCGEPIENLSSLVVDDMQKLLLFSFLSLCCWW